MKRGFPLLQLFSFHLFLLLLLPQPSISSDCSNDGRSLQFFLISHPLVSRMLPLAFPHEGLPKCAPPVPHLYLYLYLLFLIRLFHECFHFLKGLPKCAPPGLASAHPRLGDPGWLSTAPRHAVLALLALAR